MLSDEQIKQVMENNIDFASIGIPEIFDAIKEALTMAEKSMWKYPDKGELPELLKHIDFVVPHYMGRHIGYLIKNINGTLLFHSETAKINFCIDKIKAWTYAPIMED